MGTRKTTLELIYALKTLRLEKEAELTAQLEEAIREIDHEGTAEKEVSQRERENDETLRAHMVLSEATAL